ncbi:MAG TPA: PIN domain-containing protein [Tepidisphaeraceae bacterium]|nr:PIN domain-containing protein [Tepidisphaeraceae bacterium]
MVLHVLRALFILLMAAVGWFYVNSAARPLGDLNWLSLAIALTVGVFLVCIDILAPRRKLVIFSGAFLGLLIGISIAYALSFVVQLLADQFLHRLDETSATLVHDRDQRLAMVNFIDMMVGVACCYLSISFILQTKDDFRFIIPYVEFSKQTKGARPILLDTSVLIDGRITDIATTGLLESQVIVPRFVLDELQTVADSADRLKRARGRRGLDVLTKLRSVGRAEVIIYDTSTETGEHGLEVDQRLMELAKQLNGRVLTNDYNLNKVAQLRGVDVINLNELANAMKPVVLPGEKMTVRIQKPGEEAGQGVGYLEDGTMVVVEGGRQHLDEELEFTVTNTRQTVAGRMIFGRAAEGTSPPPRRPGGVRA